MMIMMNDGDGDNIDDKDDTGDDIYDSVSNFFSKPFQYFP